MARDTHEAVSNDTSAPDVTVPIPSPSPQTQPSKRQQVKQPELTKLSANFVNRSMLALDVAVQVTGDNRTDVLNRSVQVYAYIVKLMDEGKLIFVENPKTGAKERLVLL